MRFGILAFLVSLLVSPTSLVAGGIVLTVAEASLETDETRPTAVNVRLDPGSTQVFAEFTADHIGDMAEFYVEDQLVFAARVSQVTANGSLGFFPGAEDERISTAEELLEHLATGALIRVIAPPLSE